MNVIPTPNLIASLAVTGGGGIKGGIPLRKWVQRSQEKRSVLKCVYGKSHP